MLTGATLIASFGDDNTALLLYNTHTLPVPSVLSAKYFTVENGKITAIKGLFDTAVFARAQSGSDRSSGSRIGIRITGDRRGVAIGDGRVPRQDGVPRRTPSLIGRRFGP